MTKKLVFNKQIVLAVGMIVFVVAAVIGGTGAFFSDTETSVGNVFTAGAVNIAITDITHSPSTLDNLVGFTKNPTGFSFSFSDLKPLDTGTVTYTLDNPTNPAYVCARVIEKSNDDNVLTDPETKAGDTNGGFGHGELGMFLNFNFGLGNSGSLSTISNKWQDVGVINTGSSSPAAINYCFGEFSGSTCVANTAGNVNWAQTDTLTADVEFYAVQTRNNGGFTCASMNTPTTNPNLVVVNPNDLNGWLAYSDSYSTDGNTTFVSDNTATAGTGVLRLQTIGGASRVGLYKDNNFNINLAGVQITYDSKQVSAADITNGNATIRLWIDTDGDNVMDDQLMYEPYYNGFNGNTMPGWNTWTISNTQGEFWSNYGRTYSGITNTGAGGAGQMVTIAQVIAEKPTAKIIGISFSMGDGNADQVILVDNFVMNGVTYNFEN